MRCRKEVNKVSQKKNCNYVFVKYVIVHILWWILKFALLLGYQDYKTFIWKKGKTSKVFSVLLLEQLSWYTKRSSSSHVVIGFIPWPLDNGCIKFYLCPVHMSIFVKGFLPGVCLIDFLFSWKKYQKQVSLVSTLGLSHVLIFVWRDWGIPVPWTHFLFFFIQLFT